MEAPAIMRPMKRVRRIFVGGSLVAVIGTVGIGPVMAKTVTPPASAPKPARGAAPWAAPADPLRLIFAAGLRPERKETLIHHVHSHLDVFVNGARVIVPAGIGINIRDPGVKRFKAPDGSTAYGGIQLCSKPCISPLHTHDSLHTESASAVPNRLGQLFTEWGVRFEPRVRWRLLPARQHPDLRERQALQQRPTHDPADESQGDCRRHRNPAEDDSEQGDFSNA